MGYPPVERAVVRTFSIEKMRPVCPVCNPGGDTPYPSDIPQRHDTNGVVVNGKDVEKHLMQTAADIVHHKWEDGGGVSRQDVQGWSIKDTKIPDLKALSDFKWPVPLKKVF